MTKENKDKEFRFYKGSRWFSLTLILVSGLIAAGILWGANMYYDIDTGKVIIEEITQVKAKLLELTGGLKIAGGTTEITSGAGAVTIQPSGAVTVSPTGAVNITAGATSTWKTSAGDLTIKTEGTGGDLYLVSADVLDLDALTLNLNATSSFNIGTRQSATTTIKTVTFYIDASGDIRATSTKSIYLTAGKDFYIAFDAKSLIQSETGNNRIFGNRNSWINPW